MAEERNERWVIVALVVLAVAYVGYLYRDSIRISLPDLKLPFSTISYVGAALFAVVSHFTRRKRAATVRRMREENVLREGLLREESDIAVRMATGRSGGSFKADVILTRAALYVFDRSGRRDPMRLPLTRGGVEDFAVADVTFEPQGEGTEPLVGIGIVGPSTYRIEFRSDQAEWWWSDVRRALGKNADRRILDEAAAATERDLASEA